MQNLSASVCLMTRQCLIYPAQCLVSCDTHRGAAKTIRQWPEETVGKSRRVSVTTLSPPTVGCPHNACLAFRHRQQSNTIHWITKNECV